MNTTRTVTISQHNRNIMQIASPHYDIDVTFMGDAHYAVVIPFNYLSGHGCSHSYAKFPEIWQAINHAREQMREDYQGVLVLSDEGEVFEPDTEQSVGNIADIHI